MIEIPFIDAPRQTFEIDAQKGRLVVTLTFNDPMQRWYMSVSEKVGDLLLCGVLVVQGYDLFAGLTGCGKMFCHSTDGDLVPDRDNVLGDAINPAKAHLYWSP